MNLAGGLFLAVVTRSAALNLARDYRQRIVNTRVMLSLRRSLFERLLRLPLSTLWEMKTGGLGLRQRLPVSSKASPPTAAAPPQIR